MADVFDEIEIAPATDVFDEIETPVEPQPASTPVETPAPAPEQITVDQFHGFEQLSEADRARATAEVEVDLMNARKKLDTFVGGGVGAEAIDRLAGRGSRQEAIQEYEQKLGVFNALKPRYEAMTAEGQRRLAAEQAAEEDARIKREYEASGQGPNFLDAGMAYLGSKLSHLGSGVLSSIEPSFPGLGDVRRNLGEHGQQLTEFSSLNTGAPAAISRGVVDAGFMVGGNPAGFFKTVTAIGAKMANEAYGATLAATGDRGEAADVAQRTYRDMAGYMLAGTAASRVVQASLPKGMSPFRTAVLGGTGATGANVATSMAISAAKGEEYGLQQLTADVLMGGVEGGQTFKRVKAEQGGPDAQQIRSPSPPDGSVRAPEIAPENVPLPADEGGTGVQPSRQGEGVVEPAPETAPKAIDQIAAENGVKYDGPTELPGNPHQFTDERTGSTFIIKGDVTPEKVAEKTAQLDQRFELEPRERKLGPGAANIEEPFTNAEPVGAWNAKVDEQRAARGLEPLASEARKADEVTWDQAEQRMERNPSYARGLVEVINDGRKESVSDVEQTALLREMISLREARDEATIRAFDEKTYSLEERESFLREANRLEEQLQRTEEADRKSGTAQGRALRIRRLMAYEDFTLGGLMGKARRTKGEELTPEEAASIKSKADRFQKAKETFESKVEEAENLPVDEAIRAIETEAAKDPAFTPEVRSLADRIVARLEKASQGASERIRGLMSQLGSAPDVTIAPKLIKELAILAAADIGRLGIKSTLKFTRWATKMVKEFGEKVKPFLDQAWKEADAAVEEAAVGKAPREPLTDAEKAQRALDAAVVERERMDMMLAGELAPAKKQSREALTQLEEDMRAEIQAMRGLAAEQKRLDPETVRENAQVAALERAAAEYERRVNEADLGGKGKKQGADTARVAKARALRDAAKRALEAARKLANPPRTKEQIALDKYKKMAARKSAEYQQRIDKGDFGPRPKRTPLDLTKDPEAVKAKAEMERVKKEFQQKQFEWQQAQRDRIQKFVDGMKEGLGASRSIITSADVSAPFRQGGFLLMGDLVFNPVRATKQLGTMFRQLASEKGFEEAQAKLSLRPNARSGLYDQSGLYLSDLSTNLTAREESMRSNLAEKIPIVGRLVRASNRAYTGFLNRQRADAFDAMVESMGGPSKLTPDEVKAIANFVNTATGRGTVAQLERAADVAARYFFSPRFLASRFQLALGQPLLSRTGSLRVKREAAKQYGKFALGLAAIYGLAKLAGSDLERDPRSADFGKAKFGNTRVDPLAGLAQVTTFLAREITGQTKKKGRIEDRNRGETFTRFARTKLAPIPGIIADRMVEQRLDMSKPTPYRKAPLKALGEDAARLGIPLSYQEAPQVYKEHGFVRGTILEVLNLLGMGVQSYDKR